MRFEGEMTTIRRYLALIVFVALATGCDRRQPTPCAEVIADRDFGSFELALGGLARDLDSRLEWFRCSVGQRFNGSKCIGEPKIERWEDAQALISEINEKSGTDWRLPTLKELKSITLSECGNPAVNTNVFVDIMVENYWASDESPHIGFRCGMYTFSGATSCRLFDNLERPFLMVRKF